MQNSVFIVKASNTSHTIIFYPKAEEISLTIFVNTYALIWAYLLLQCLMAI